MKSKDIWKKKPKYSDSLKEERTILLNRIITNHDDVYNKLVKLYFKDHFIEELEKSKKNILIIFNKLLSDYPEYMLNLPDFILTMIAKMYSNEFTQDGTILCVESLIEAKKLKFERKHNNILIHILLKTPPKDKKLVEKCSKIILSIIDGRYEIEEIIMYLGPKQFREDQKILLNLVAQEIENSVFYNYLETPQKNKITNFAHKINNIEAKKNITNEYTPVQKKINEKSVNDTIDNLFGDKYLVTPRLFYIFTSIIFLLILCDGVS